MVYRIAVDGVLVVFSSTSRPYILLARSAGESGSRAGVYLVGYFSCLLVSQLISYSNP